MDWVESVKAIARVVAIVCLALLAAMLFSNREDTAQSTHARASDSSDSITKCYERGVAYFKEIGSYPTLSDGRLAGDVAAERCDRSKQAF